MPEDLSLRAFLAQVLDGLFSVDGRLLRTLRLLVTKPGGLSREHVDGKRVRSFRPIQVFLVANFLFFLCPWSPNTLSTSFNTQMEGMPTSSIAYGLMAGKVQGRAPQLDDGAAGAAGADATARQGALDAELAAYRAEYEERFPRLAQALVLLMIPAFAAVLALLHRRGHMAVEHLVFSLHFFAFFLSFLTVEGIVFAALPRAVTSWLTGSGNFLELFFGVVFFLYLWRAGLRFYGRGPWGEALRMAAACVGLVLVLTAYRFGIFLIVHAGI